MVSGIARCCKNSGYHPEKTQDSLDARDNYRYKIFQQSPESLHSFSHTSTRNLTVIPAHSGSSAILHYFLFHYLALCVGEELLPSCAQCQFIYSSLKKVYVETTTPAHSHSGRSWGDDPCKSIIMWYASLIGNSFTHFLYFCDFSIFLSFLFRLDTVLARAAVRGHGFLFSVHLVASIFKHIYLYHVGVLWCSMHS